MQVRYDSNMPSNISILKHVTHYSSERALQKCASLPCVSDTTDSSSASIESQEEEYRQQAVRWMLSATRRVAKDTNYLALSYFNRLMKHSIPINEQNYQRVGLAMLLLASKMNQIYPPKITSLLSRCRVPTTREDIIAMEESILFLFNFDLAIQHTPYTHIVTVLRPNHLDRLEECEKLLRIVAPFRQIYQFGDEVLAYAIVYLILPNYIREMKLRDAQRVKTLAIKIYSLYNNSKERYEKEKENRAAAR